MSDDVGVGRAWAGLPTLRLADGPDEMHRRTLVRLELKRQAEEARLSLGR